MITKAQKVRLGVFLSITFGLLILFILVIAGSKLFERVDSYYIAYEDVSVSGLQIGAQVKYHGIRVGSVEIIRIDPEDANRIIVEVKVEKDTPIKEDTEASLILVGITGLKQVELFGGTREAKRLEPGSYILAGKTFFDDISVSVEEITTKLDRVLSNIDILTGTDNQERVANLLSNLETVSLSAINAVEKIEKTVHSQDIELILANTSKFTEELAATDIQGVVTDMKDAIEQANKTFTQVDLMVSRSRRDILLSLETLKQTIDNLEEFSRQLSEDPSLILRRK